MASSHSPDELSQLMAIIEGWEVMQLTYVSQLSVSVWLCAGTDAFEVHCERAAKGKLRKGLSLTKAYLGI